VISGIKNLVTSLLQLLVQFEQGFSHIAMLAASSIFASSQ
jgi:hypothetical protein